MKLFRNIIFFILFIILGLNFLLDFSFIYNQFGTNSKKFIAEYLIVHKNTNNLEKQIKELKKERNLYSGQKRLFEKAYNDLYEENIETKNDSELLYTIL